MESTKWIPAGNFGWNFGDDGNGVNRIQSIYPVSRGMRELVNQLSGLNRVIFSHVWKVQNEFLQENLDGTFGMLGMLYIGYKVFILCPEGWGNGLIHFPAQTSNIQSYLDSTKWIPPGRFGWNFWDTGNVVYRIQSIYPVSWGMREWVNKLSGLKQVIFSHIWKVQNEFLQENLDGTFGMRGML